MMFWSVYSSAALTLVASACILSLTAFRIWRRLRPTRQTGGDPRPLLFFAAILALLLVPIDGTPLFFSLRAAINELSVTTLVLALTGLLGEAIGRDVIPSDQRGILLHAVACLALLFYPLCLGLGPVDPYAWGYFSTPMLAALGLAAVAALIHRDDWIVLIIGASLLGGAAGLLQSTNLWDYLIDPVLALYAMTVITTNTARSVLRRLTNPTSSLRSFISCSESPD